MTDWQAVQKEMLELEQFGENADVLSTIAAILGADIEGLHETLSAETERVVRLMDNHYAGHAVRTPRNYAAIGLLQGITFASAYARVNQENEGEDNDELDLSDADVDALADDPQAEVRNPPIEGLEAEARAAARRAAAAGSDEENPRQDERRS